MRNDKHEETQSESGMPAEAFTFPATPPVFAADITAMDKAELLAQIQRMQREIDRLRYERDIYLETIYELSALWSRKKSCFPSEELMSMTAGPAQF